MLKELRLQLDRLGAKRELAFDTGRAERANKRLAFYTRIVTKVLDAERCSVFINDPRQEKAWLKAGTGLAEHDIEVPKEGSIVGKVMETGEKVVLKNLDREEGAHKKADAKTGFVTRNVLCVPIQSPQHDETIGAFQVLNKRQGREFDDEDVAMLEEIAEQLRMDVAAVFLDQEIYGVGEKIYQAARRTVNFVVGGIVAVLLLLFLLILAYVVVPAF